LLFSGIFGKNLLSFPLRKSLRDRPHRKERRKEPFDFAQDKRMPRKMKLRGKAGKSKSGLTRYEEFIGFKLCNRTYALGWISRK